MYEDSTMHLTRFRALLLLLGTLIAATPAGAQGTLPAETKTEPGTPASGFAPTAYAEPTADFENDVRELDALQTQMAKYAAQKGSPRIQAFAKQVNEEFSGGKGSLKGKSDNAGVPIVGTKKLAREHQTLLDLLQADGANVDRLFVDFEVLALKESLGLVEAYATGGVEARLRQASAEAVSADRLLLATARTLQQQ